MISTPPRLSGPSWRVLVTVHASAESLLITVLNKVTTLAATGLKPTHNLKTAAAL